jgi:nucleoside-diphosphate-sugar epimerase
VGKRAFLLGGTGKTGRVLASRLAEDGWDVVLASRGEREVPAHFEHVRVDRANPDALRDALGNGADVLVDFVAFEPGQAEQLLSLRDLVGSLVVLSSGAVYDYDGQRPLPVPVPEDYRTVEPGSDTYASNKAALERALLEQDVLPATLLRAGAIYGPGDTASREWWFVKRVLDGRRFVPLAYRGASRFHPVSVHTLAELIRLAAERPGTRVLNAGDPEAPTVLEIARAIGGVLEHEWVEILLDGPPHNEVVGDSPWGAPHPWVLDMTEAELRLRYRPVTSYERAVPETVQWLIEVTRDQDWREALPRVAEYYANLFDYDAEDAYLRRLTEP